MGMSRLFRGNDRETRTAVAVKVCRGDVDAGCARFLCEIHMLRALRNPQIVAHVTDGNLVSGLPFLVTQWVPHPTLAGILARYRPLPASAVVRFGVSLLQALEFVHNQGIVHRDISPGNVLVDPFGRVTLLDFGLAHIAVKEQPGLTDEGMTVGTPAYMAPEQLLGHFSISSDVYAVGAILHEALAGARSFAAENDEVEARLHRDAPRLHVPGAPESLTRLIARSLRRDPSRRPATARDFASALQATVPRSDGPLFPSR